MPKNLKTLNNKWISATATHNYFNEPLLDWFKYQSVSKKHTNINNRIQIKPYLAEKGDQFEETIIKS